MKFSISKISTDDISRWTSCSILSEASEPHRLPACYCCYCIRVMGERCSVGHPPWPTQNFCWVGHNAFGPTNNWPVYSL